jgi:hypothetical protein
MLKKINILNRLIIQSNGLSSFARCVHTKFCTKYNSVLLLPPTCFIHMVVLASVVLLICEQLCFQRIDI